MTGRAAAQRQHAHAGLELVHGVVAHARALGVDDERLAAGQRGEGRLEGGAIALAAPDGDRAELGHRPAQSGVAEQLGLGEVAHRPRKRMTDEERVELALVVGGDERRAGRRQVGGALARQPVGRAQCETGDRRARCGRTSGRRARRAGRASRARSEPGHDDIARAPRRPRRCPGPTCRARRRRRRGAAEPRRAASRRRRARPWRAASRRRRHAHRRRSAPCDAARRAPRVRPSGRASPAPPGTRRCRCRALR